jgi:predicted NBD/HSP70 family sugar kinase
MHNLTGKPEIMKKMNIELIYKALIELHSATRAEITEITKVSATTVRALLEELLASGEIIVSGIDESSGGRRAQRYMLNKNHNLILSLFIEKGTIIYQICDLSANVLTNGAEKTAGNNLSIAAIQFVTRLQKKWDICAIGLGVPGIVEKGHYYVSSGFNIWYINNLGEQLQETFHLPVILENDLNAIALGFAIHYAEKNADCDISSINITYIHLNDDCTGAGIITDGKIVHGAKHFAGEFGFMPMLPDKTLDVILKEAASEKDYADAVARLVAIINCVSNPSLVVIGGTRIQNQSTSLDSVKIAATAYISDLTFPEIIFSKGYKNDYLSGLSYLTIQDIIPKLPFAAAE